MWGVGRRESEHDVPSDDEEDTKGIRDGNQGSSDGTHDLVDLLHASKDVEDAQQPGGKGGGREGFSASRASCRECERERGTERESGKRRGQVGCTVRGGAFSRTGRQPS